MQNHRKSAGFLLFCSLGVFVSYFIYGILQETITKTKYGQQQTEFTFIKPMLFIQCFINVLVASQALNIWPEQSSTISAKSYALCALSYIGAMFTSNTSLRFVNYPTQVVGKSIKPIPVMLLNVLWARKRYPLKKYLYVIMITIGVILFMYKGNTDSKSSISVIGGGEILLFISLALDGLTGGMQEDFRSRYQVGPYTLMCNLNLWSLFYLGLGIVLTGESASFFAFVRSFPMVLVNILGFGAISAIGQMFIYTMIVNFGSLMCSIVTTTRKFFSVLASLLLFGHALSSQQLLGAGLVFAGLIADQTFGKTKKTTTTVANDDHKPKKQ